MDYSKAKKCSDFIDKAQAVGHVACLEDHFRRISKMLDEAGVPKERQAGILRSQEKLTVKQRVQCVLLALLNVCGDDAFAMHHKNEAEMFRNYLFKAVKEVEPDEDIDFDPEELNAYISDEPATV